MLVDQTLPVVVNDVTLITVGLVNRIMTTLQVASNSRIYACIVRDLVNKTSYLQAVPDSRMARCVFLIMSVNSNAYLTFIGTWNVEF